MKILHSAILALTIGLASVSSAYARDSFSLGVNVGGYGYAPPAVYYPAQRVVYYDAPQVYYRPAPRVYYQPLVSYRYYDHDRRAYGRGWDRDGWGHEGREHHGWGRGRDDHEGWGRGRDHEEGRR